LTTVNHGIERFAYSADGRAIPNVPNTGIGLK
jgi:hypothetical protein